MKSWVYPRAVVGRTAGRWLGHPEVVGLPVWYRLLLSLFPIAVWPQSYHVLASGDATIRPGLAGIAWPWSCVRGITISGAGLLAIAQAAGLFSKMGIGTEPRYLYPCSRNKPHPRFIMHGCMVMWMLGKQEKKWQTPAARLMHHCSQV